MALGRHGDYLEKMRTVRWLLALAALTLLPLWANDDMEVEEWLPGDYRAESSDSRHVIVKRVDGVPEFRHVGTGSWLATGYQRLAVKPGEAYEFSCRTERVSDEGLNEELSVGITVYDVNGKVLFPSWGRRDFHPGENCRFVFLVPNGAAFIEPHFRGKGRVEVAFPQARMTRGEDVEAATPQEDLPAELCVSGERLEVVYSTSNGVFAVTDKRTGRRWSSTPSALISSRTIVVESAIRKTMFALRFVDAELLSRYTVVCRLLEDGSELEVMLSAEPDMVFGDIPLAFPSPFVSRKGDRVILPYGEGIGVAVDSAMGLSRYAAFSGQRLTMPFGGVVEDATGAGWMMIMETPDDAYAICSQVGEEKLWSLGAGWIGTRGVFGYTRRVRYAFFDQGGYVAMAKRYRSYVRGKGKLRTFREKMAARPNVEKLPGAVNVWYSPRRDDPASPEIVREMLGAGIDRILWSREVPLEEARELGAIDGVIASREVDGHRVYRPEQLVQLGWGHGDNEKAWPRDVVWNSNSATDWRQTPGESTKDGEPTYCAVLCDSMAPYYVRRRLLGELAIKPQKGILLSGEDSPSWIECNNPAHLIGRADSRYWQMELSRMVGEDFKLVVGSTHAHDALAPYCDYMENLMSFNAWRMPQGGRPRDFTDAVRPEGIPAAALETVKERNLSAALRLPLWELVYHDCCVAYWHRADASNWPICFWKTRDLFNALYGTPGLFAFDSVLWRQRKARFVESYRVWGPIARRTGCSEMIDHRFLSSDHLVQRTEFADGTVVTVNFGDAEFKLPDGLSLPPQSVAHNAGR